MIDLELYKQKLSIFGHTGIVIPVSEIQANVIMKKHPIGIVYGVSIFNRYQPIVFIDNNYKILYILSNGLSIVNQQISKIYRTAYHSYTIHHVAESVIIRKSREYIIEKNTISKI